MNSPRNDSLVPLVYMLAVSMKLPPGFTEGVVHFWASSWAAPTPVIAEGHGAERRL